MKTRVLEQENFVKAIAIATRYAYHAKDRQFKRYVNINEQSDGVRTKDGRFIPRLNQMVREHREIKRKNGKRDWKKFMKDEGLEVLE